MSKVQRSDYCMAVLTPSHSLCTAENSPSVLEEFLLPVLHVEVLHGTWIVLEVHLFCYIIIFPDLTYSIYGRTEMGIWILL